MNDTNLYVNLTEQQEDALTNLEIAVESGIENCLTTLKIQLMLWSKNMNQR